MKAKPRPKQGLKTSKNYNSWHIFGVFLLLLAGVLVPTVLWPSPVKPQNSPKRREEKGPGEISSETLPETYPVPAASIPICKQSQKGLASFFQSFQPHFDLSTQTTEYLDKELGFFDLRKLPVKRSSDMCVEIPNIQNELNNILKSNKPLFLLENHEDIFSTHKTEGRFFLNYILRSFPEKPFLFMEAGGALSSSLLADYPTKFPLDTPLVATETWSSQSVNMLSQVMKEALFEKSGEPTLFRVTTDFLTSVLSPSAIMEWQELLVQELQPEEKRVLSTILDITKRHDSEDDRREKIDKALMPRMWNPQSQSHYYGLLRLMIRYSEVLSQKILKLDLTSEQFSLLNDHIDNLKQYAKKIDQPAIKSSILQDHSITPKRAVDKINYLSKVSAMSATLEGRSITPKLVDRPIANFVDAIDTFFFHQREYGIFFRNSLWCETIVNKNKEHVAAGNKCPKIVISLGGAHASDLRQRLLNHPEFNRLCANEKISPLDYKLAASSPKF